MFFALTDEQQAFADTVRDFVADRFDLDAVRELGLLTTKPFIYVFNSDDGVLGDEAKQQELRDLVAPADAVFLDAKIEAELLEQRRLLATAQLVGMTLDGDAHVRVALQPRCLAV